jgi:hypothetical protein
MRTKFQLAIVNVTGHFHDKNSRTEIIKINLTEIGRGIKVDSTGSGSTIVTYALEHCYNLWFPGNAGLLNIFASQEQIRLKEYCSVLVTRGLKCGQDGLGIRLTRVYGPALTVYAKANATYSTVTVPAFDELGTGTFQTSRATEHASFPATPLSFVFAASSLRKFQHPGTWLQLPFLQLNP